jgi:hypothetical protein
VRIRVPRRCTSGAFIEQVVETRDWLGMSGSPPDLGSLHFLGEAAILRTMQSSHAQAFADRVSIGWQRL